MDRVERVREKMREHAVDGLLLTNFEEGRVNIRYLTGFTGSASACLISEDALTFVTDTRYATQALEEVQKRDERWDVIIDRDELGFIAKLAESRGIKRLGLVKSEESWGTVIGLNDTLDSCELVALPNIVGEVREVKDDGEVERIQKAVIEMEGVLRHIFTLIRPGVSDRELATELKIALMRRGLEVSFSPIIVSGAHSAIIHGNPFELPYKEVAEGDIIQFDVGCMVDGYASDISRVAVCGVATGHQRKMHAALIRAISESKKSYKPGVNFWDVHKQAQKIIEEEGFPPFEHGLGHGLGMEVHDPFVHPRIFKVGNVVTLEPGTYKKGYGGMRIERDVLITKSGSRYLDRLTTTLKEVPIK